MKYYYLVKEENVIWDMLKYSYISWFDETPDLDALLEHKKSLRQVVDKDDNNQKYSIIKFRHSFSNPMQGYKYYLEDAMITELEDIKWSHTGKDYTGEG